MCETTLINGCVIVENSCGISLQMYTPSAPPAYEDVLNQMPNDTSHNYQIDVPTQTQPQLSIPIQSQRFNSSPSADITSNRIAIVSRTSGGFQSRLCTGCHLPLRTRIGYRATGKTHLTFLLCCIFCCFLCAPYVYCVDSCREPQVYCRACGSMVLL